MKTDDLLWRPLKAEAGKEIQHFKDLEIKCLVADFRLESIRQILIFKTQHVLCLHSVITQAALSDIIFAFDNAWLGLTSL